MRDREWIVVKVERDQQGGFKRGFKREGHGRERSAKKRKKTVTWIPSERSHSMVIWWTKRLSPFQQQEGNELNEVRWFLLINFFILILIIIVERWSCVSRLFSCCLGCFSWQSNPTFSFANTTTTTSTFSLSPFCTVGFFCFQGKLDSEHWSPCNFTLIHLLLDVSICSRVSPYV
jgi:hypothetical protein